MGQRGRSPHSSRKQRDARRSRSLHSPRKQHDARRGISPHSHQSRSSANVGGNRGRSPSPARQLLKDNGRRGRSPQPTSNRNQRDRTSSPKNDKNNASSSRQLPDDVLRLKINSKATRNDKRDHSEDEGSSRRQPWLDVFTPIGGGSYPPLPARGSNLPRRGRGY
jgi:hypothetical protein